MKAMLNKFLLMMAALLGLAACATPPASPPAAGAAPLLRLAPSALGRTLALQQQLTVQAGNRVEHIDVLLEADAQTLRLALLGMGQTGASLEWDGHDLKQTQASWWPRAVKAERVLSELQLALWPADAVRQALPPGWTLEADAATRLLRQGDQAVIRIRYPSPTRVELLHLRDGYRIDAESRNLEDAP
jgi:hypothetical protein